MVGRRIAKVATGLTVLLFLILLFLYTMAFPASASWFILLFFLFAFLGLYLTTRFKWGASEAFLIEAPDGSKDIQMKLKTRGWLPILLPEVHLRLAMKEGYAEVEMPLYFKNSISPLFRDVHLPRGRHEQVRLETYGRDHFGVFFHYSKHAVPAKIDIYPESLTEKERSRYLRRIAAHPLLRDYLKSNAAQFRQLREHGPRDELKHIDWKTSAKMQKLMVKEYERETMPVLTVSFWGLDVPEFEKLLQVAYNLIQDLETSVQLHLCLVGQYGDVAEVLFDESSFLTIQPTPKMDALQPIWQDLKITSGYHIAIMPDVVLENLKERRSEQTLFLTEKTFSDGGEPFP